MDNRWKTISGVLSFGGLVWFFLTLFGLGFSRYKYAASEVGILFAVLVAAALVNDLAFRRTIG